MSWMRWSEVLLAVIFLFAVPDSPARADESRSIQENLFAFLDGQLPPEQVTITYTDIHGLWGGLEITIEGTGKVNQRVLPPSLEKEVSAQHDLSLEEVSRLAHLLIQLEVWEQKVPDREAMADEGRAYLRLKLGKSSREIWEWYNDLEANNRLVRIREMMRELVVMHRK